MTQFHPFELSSRLIWLMFIILILTLKRVLAHQALIAILRTPTKIPVDMSFIFTYDIHTDTSYVVIEVIHDACIGTPSSGGSRHRVKAIKPRPNTYILAAQTQAFQDARTPPAIHTSRVSCNLVAWSVTRHKRNKCAKLTRQTTWEVPKSDRPTDR